MCPGTETRLPVGLAPDGWCVSRAHEWQANRYIRCLSKRGKWRRAIGFHWGFLLAHWLGHPWQSCEVYDSLMNACGSSPLHTVAGRAVSSMNSFMADASLHGAATWKAAHLLWPCIACTQPAWTIGFSWAGRKGGHAAVRAMPPAS